MSYYICTYPYRAPFYMHDGLMSKNFRVLWKSSKIVLKDLGHRRDQIGLRCQDMPRGRQHSWIMSGPLGFSNSENS